ncbi:MAG: helix-turn-helix domain-containing protein [Flavobacteriales bacterium]|nr:helix-turn-helix domain-containing protein [Flavobacteriales bacterium]
MRFSVLVLPLLMCLLTSTAHEPALRDRQHSMVAMRAVGHQLLLSAGDSHSRVLPIEQEANGYRIRFDTTFSFDPDRLVTIVDSVMRQSGIATAYLVEVQQCSTLQVVYSYSVNPAIGPGAVACRSRPLPADCHTLFISFAESKAVMADDHTMGASPADGLLPIALAVALVIGAIGLIWAFRGKGRHHLGSGTDPALIPIGRYLFDTRKIVLQLGADRAELTGKEADLLALLHASVNTTVERDVILRDVWGDEGAYVGRTLDVFISRLRKKLEADPDVRIVNVRGVGYKLIVGSTEMADR